MKSPLKLHDKVIDIIVTLSDNRRMKARLINEEDNFYLQVAKNPFGHYSSKIIDYASCKVNGKTLTLIHCTMRTSSLQSTVYLVQELYAGRITKKPDAAVYGGLNAEISILRDWFLPDVYDTKLNTGGFDFTINVKQPYKKEYKAKPGLKIAFHAKYTVDTSIYTLGVERKASFEMRYSSPTARQNIHRDLITFLNLLTLLMRKIPETIALEIIHRQTTIPVIFPGLAEQTQASDDSVLEYRDISDFESRLQSYYQHRAKLDPVISLWEVCMKPKVDPQFVFLHLTQALEVAHKYFYEKKGDPEMLSKYLATTYPDRFEKPKKGWTQIKRYRHCVILCEKQEITLPGKVRDADFLLYLLDSRNFYTHRDEKKQFVWSFFQLYAVNHLLRAWIRALLLNFLGFEVSEINRGVEKDRINSIDTDIEKNPFSMRYRGGDS